MTPQAWVLIFTGIVLAIVCVCAFMRCKSSVREADNAWLDEISKPFREEYDATFEADYGDYDSAGNRKMPVGWQGWEGGECPVPWHTEVVVMRIGGMIYKPVKAGYLGGWDHREHSNDIVAWRVAD